MKIAIRGHESRGKEVIQILESLGGKNVEKLEGTHKTFYYIDDKNEIGDEHEAYFPSTYKLYTLEEFEKEFPFKIGDRVISLTTGLIGIIIKFSENGIYHLKYDNGIYSVTSASYLKPYKEMKKERNITLTLDKAKEWYKKGGELKEIALQAFSEKELNPLPRSWEEFCDQYSNINDTEYFIDTYSNIERLNDVVHNHCRLMNTDKNICPSKESAEAHLAMIQLEQLRNCWRQGNIPQEVKYKIRKVRNKYIVVCGVENAFLSFCDIQTAEEFLECFRDLIEKAGDLI